MALDDPALVVPITKFRKSLLAFGVKKNAQNAHRGRNKPGDNTAADRGSRPFGDAMVWCACRSNYLGQMMAPSSNPVYSERFLSRVAWFDRLTKSWALSGDSLSGKKLQRHLSKPASSLQCALTKNAPASPVESAHTK